MPQINLSALSFLFLATFGCARAQTVNVEIDATTRYQTIDGFGTCLVSWDDAMSAWYRRPEAARIYGDDLRFNILRCNLWGDGTIPAKTAPSQIRHTDAEFARRDTRTPVFLDFAKAVRRYQPDLKVIGTVWSPPAWMKFNGSITDRASGAIDGTTYLLEQNGRREPAMNRVRPEAYPLFTQWLVEMVKHYEANGVPLYAVSPANEPQFTQSFESCLWNATDLATITAMTGAALRDQGLGRVRLFGPETMTGFNWEGGPNIRYTEAMRANRDAFRSLSIWSTHGYADGVVGDVSSNSSAKFWSLIERDRKPYWVTEGGTGEHEWPAPVGPKGVGIAIHNAFVAGNASAFVPWQYAENSRSEHNLMPLEGPNKKTHVVRHYSRFIPAGAVRIAASPAYGSLNVSAFKKGKEMTVVLLNTTSRPEIAKVKLAGATVSRFNVVRTSATEDSKTLPPLVLKGGRGSIEVSGPGIVTLTTLR